MLKKSNYVITGICRCSGENIYWNNDQGWIHEFDKATTFDYEILTVPLPIGGTGFMEVSEEGEPRNFFSVITLTQPQGGIKIF